MNRCLHNTAYPTDGCIISSHYGGLQESWDLCGRTERLTSSPPDRAQGGPRTRVVLQQEPKLDFSFCKVSSQCGVKGSECQGPNHEQHQRVCGKKCHFNLWFFLYFGLKLFLLIKKKYQLIQVIGLCSCHCSPWQPHPRRCDQARGRGWFSIGL